MAEHNKSDHSKLIDDPRAQGVMYGLAALLVIGTVITLIRAFI
ncbi:hypothetical protein [Pseudoclavibacter soli]|nr:hypothetical protein [Pseudoclavibacter soli]